MDPTENLREQIRLARRLSGDDMPGMLSSTLGADAVRLAELVLALDAWICQGGFLPDVWRWQDHDR